MMPPFERMQFCAIDQCSRGIAGEREAIEIPLVRGEPRFEQQTRRDIDFGHGIDGLQMEEPLFRLSASVRPKDDLPRECFRSGQWVNIYKQSIIDAVEFYRFALG